MHPKYISIRDYTYTLPEFKVASYPLSQRDASRLLIYEKGKISEDHYLNIADHIPEQALMVFNNTKVIEARLLFKKPTGGIIEIFCLEPHEQYADISTSMLQKEKVLWQCLVGGASKWKHGQVLEKRIRSGSIEIILRAVYIEKRPGSFVIEFSWTPPEFCFAEILHLAGVIPLPPYIKREVEEADKENYQTIYANREGSVAAPTAGLHFTQSIFEKLETKNIQCDYITLHVGAATFKPVKSETMQDHEMHAEFIDISKDTIENILFHLDNTIVAVGTTSLRTVESLYWLGVKQSTVGSRQSAVRSRQSAVHSQQSTEESGSSLYLSQWEAYELAKQNISTADALESLLVWMNKNKLERLVGKTQILIAPGYPFKLIKGLITNFHQPQSTLLLLVAAFIGDDWRKVYDHALENDFRFLSYGDGCLLWGKEE